MPTTRSGEPESPAADGPVAVRAGAGVPDTSVSRVSRPALDAVPAPVLRAALVIGIGALMTQLDSALVNVGLKTIAVDLHSGLNVAQWAVSGYLLGLVTGLPLCAWGARRLGAGRLWLVALAAFTAVSVVCALSVDMPMLLASRVLQGMAGGLLLPAGQTVIAQLAGRALMGRVMSAVGLMLVLGPGLGPVFGGLLIDHGGWRWLFLVNLPLGGLALALGSRLVPRGEPGAGLRFDGLGFALACCALPAFAFAVDRLRSIADLFGPRCYVPLAFGAVAATAFALRSLRIPDPLLRTALLRRPILAAACVCSFLAGGVQVGALVIWALYFQSVSGYSTAGTGLAMIGFALGAAFLPIAGRMTDRYGGAVVTLIGAILTAAVLVPGSATAHGVGRGTAALVLNEAVLVLLGLGNALSIVPPAAAAYVTIPLAEVPAAVTLVNVFLRFGGALASSLTIALLGGDGSGARPAADFLGPMRCLEAFAAANVIAALWLHRARQRHAGS